MLAISVLASVVAFRGWNKIITPWVKRRRRATNIAELGVGDWPGLIGAFLPRRARQVWNVFVMTVCVLFLGLPHFLVLRTFFRPGELDPWYWVHFAWTLIWWLIVLALPTALAASHRLSLLSNQENDGKDS